MAQNLNLTWSMMSFRARGVGLTRVMSCAAADVMSNPADCIPGCMRGASDSRLYGDSGEGKLKELAVTTCSICSIDDCMMLARLFNSTNPSWEILCKWPLKRVMLSSLTSTVHVGHTSR